MTGSETSAPRATGRCHCGAVRIAVHGPLRDVVVCHCSDCQRIHGAPAAHTAARRADLRIEGEASLKWYDSSSAARRGFCAQCGSALFYDVHGRDIVSICGGCLDGPTRTKVALHAFTRSRQDYEATDASAPRHETFPDPMPTLEFT